MVKKMLTQKSLKVKSLFTKSNIFTQIFLTPKQKFSIKNVVPISFVKHQKTIISDLRFFDPQKFETQNSDEEGIGLVVLSFAPFWEL